jgi:hypothetical protein
MKKGTVIVLFVAGGFILYVLFSLLNAEPVKVTSELDRSGDLVSVQGELSNVGDASGPVTVEVRYYNDAGTTIARDTLNLHALAKGASEQFQSPRRTLRGVASYSIYLNHGRNPYGN